MNLLLFWIAITFSMPLYAETVVTQRIRQTRQFIPLKKLTVGPYDQYHGLLSSDEDTVFFTRKSELVPHICSQDMKSGQVKELLPLTADSQEPALYQNELLAFTYFQNRASGEICYAPLDHSQLNMKKIRCISSGDKEASTPFWKNSEELGYLLRDPWTQTNQIILENLRSGEKTILAEGKIWSPAITRDGVYLFYNEIPEVQEAYKRYDRVLVMKNLITGKKKELRFSLPGISGFPSVSEDGKYLYFSHYLNDTNGDNIIDGKDNSVIFRVEMSRLSSLEEVFPEQLTSVASNCSFPKPQGEKVLVTCAFEGSLDIYEMPATGVIPVDWDLSILNNAHQTSRSYADRILILNTLKFRFPQFSSSAFEERILSNYIFADDLQAAKYSVKQLQTENKDFYRLIELYLDARERKKVQKLDYISPSFQKELLAIDHQLKNSVGNESLKKILRGLIRSFINDKEASLEFLKQVKLGKGTHPLERILYFELATWVIPRVDTSEAISPFYCEMMRAPELTEESKIYYAFKFLEYVQRIKSSLLDRIRLISQANDDLSLSVSSLLSSEIAVLKMMTAVNENEKMAFYRGLDQKMNESKSNYFLRKALYVRAILNFEEAAEFKFLNFVAANWLRYTQNNDTEFSYARTVYANSSLDQAYSNLGKGQLDLAGNYFYGSLSLTDDLESHSGYVQTLVSKGQRAILGERYQNMKERKFIDENQKYVDALLILIDEKAEDKKNVKALDQAIQKLQSMTENRDASMRYLLLGYCYLEKLLRVSNGYEFDHEIFEEANRNLMLAYDQGRGNPRVEASALFDLALLHQRVGNHGLATQFFNKRKALGFVSSEEKARVSWLYARSLFFNYQPELASLELNQIVEVPKGFQIPVLERRAFYLALSGKYWEALEAYEGLIKNNLSDLKRSQVNLAKIYLSYGYTLFKLKKLDESKSALNLSIQYASQLNRIPKSRDRWIQFEPARIQMMALGFLSQMGTRSEKTEALKKRLALLRESQGIFNADEWIPNQIRNHLQIAALLTPDDLKQAAHHLEEALDLALVYGKASQYLAYAAYRATVDYWVHRIQYPQAYEGRSYAQGQKLIEQILKVYDQQPFGQAALDDPRLTLQLLWNLFSDPNSGELDRILQSESAERLKKNSPEKWGELQKLLKGLRSNQQERRDHL